jgi:ribosome-associated protein
MLQITEAIRIPESEFEWAFVRSAGPGGQNVNKVASKAVLRWNVATSLSLPDDVRGRLQVQQRWRMTLAGDLIITSQRYRDQQRNKVDCLEKLRDYIAQAAVVPKPRKKMKPTRASRERRLGAKHHRSTTKLSRRRPVAD